MPADGSSVAAPASPISTEEHEDGSRGRYADARLDTSVLNRSSLPIDVLPGDPTINLPSFHIRKGDTVIFSSWAMGRMRKNLVLTLIFLHV